MCENKLLTAAGGLSHQMLPPFGLLEVLFPKILPMFDKTKQAANKHFIQIMRFVRNNPPKQDLTWPATCSFFE